MDVTELRTEELEELREAYFEQLLEMDDEVFTIYNYKDGKNYNGKSGAKTKDITNWHIGGFKSSEKLIDYLKS